MKVATASQMKEIDSYTIEKIGVPGIVLMENAAIRIMQEIDRDLSGAAGKNIVIFAGKGNNGGDALAVSRHLYNMGANVLVILAAPENTARGEAGTNLRILKNMGIGMVVVEDSSFYEEIAASLCLADAVVDGLVGTGVRGEIEGLLSDLIDIINHSRRYVVSIDIPSGVCGDTGRVCGNCIRANKTVTLGLPKLGLLVGQGAMFTGEIKVVDIGIPDLVVKEKGLTVSLVGKDYVESIMPLPSLFGHKGDHGRVLILGGSTGMTGAGVMAANAALRTGSGLVTLAVPCSLHQVVETKLTEVMTVPLADDGSGFLSMKCIDLLEDIINRYSVLAVGPGLGQGPEVSGVVSWIVEHCPVPIIIDADGINSIYRNIDVLNKAKSPVVLTPHIGEMARLIGKPVEEILEDKVGVLEQYCRRWNCTVVLKDWRTIIGTAEGHMFINTTGNSGMATGGTGDVLTGVITSLAGQGIDPVHAATAGTYIHGLAGDMAALTRGRSGMIAGDIIGSIPEALRQFEKYWPARPQISE